VGSQVKYCEVLLRYLKTYPRWLDLGCGHQFLPDWAWVPDERLLRALPRLVGVDYDFESLKAHTLLDGRVRCDIGNLPLQDGSFDLVTANMVMEHVQQPERVLSEAHRVLSPNGVFLLHTPNRSSPLVSLAACVPQKAKNWLINVMEDRCDDDIYPTVYKYNTFPAVARISEQAGFRLESCEFVVSEAFTQALGPLAIFELLYIRMTQWSRFAQLRPDIIAVLRPTGKAALAAAAAAR